MPKINRKLTDVEIKNSKPKDKAYKVYDEGGLFLLVRPTGTKVWQLPYRLDSKYNTYTIGQYPEIGGAEARKRRDEIKAQIREGHDPNRTKEITRRMNIHAGETSFEAVARNWHGKQIWAPKHTASILSRLENDVFPTIGYKQISQVTAQDILAILYDVEARGALDMVRRINQYCVAIFDHGIAMGLCEYNPAIGRTKALKPNKTKHRPHLKADQLPDFLNRLDNYQGGKLVQLALKFLLLTFVRPGELRWARWDEIDFKKAEWRIPAARMKMKRDHFVPLSSQAIEVLKELKGISGEIEILFPGQRKISTPISDVTLTKALIIMGYVGDNKIVPHGFRATASTILNESGLFRPDVIERQLAHIEPNKSRASYNHSDYPEERKHMMQWWGDYINSKRGEANHE